MLARQPETAAPTCARSDREAEASTQASRGSATLVSPRALKREIPRSFAARALVEGARARIRSILHGDDRHRLLVVVGPCSIHSREDALEYGQRLRRLCGELGDDLVIVMRTYFEKPRTRGGWKGFLNDPALDGSCDTARGIELARRLLLELAELGLPCASEFLDPLATAYLEDLVSWAAIGARTSESQTHRELASRLPMPVGFKNSTDGRVDVAWHAMAVARQQHSVFALSPDGLPAVLRTGGNRDSHIVLRGGGGRPNCHPDAIRDALRLGAESELARPLLVDCSHENSGSDPARQAPNARSIVELAGAGERGIAGLMLEGHLRPGSQPWRGDGRAESGLSLTDPCMGWEETEALLRELAGRQKIRREKA